MTLLKVWLPLIVTALGTAAASFSETAQQWILHFAAQHMDYTVAIAGIYALIANLLPSPAAFQKLVDEYKAKAKSEVTAEVKAELKEEVKYEVAQELQE